VTGDEAQWTLGKRKKEGEARFLLPVSLCAQLFIKEETSWFEAAPVALPCGKIPPASQKSG